MFNSTFKNTALSTLAAALVATSLSINPAIAGGGDGGGNLVGDHNHKCKVSTISTTNADGSTTSVRSCNGAKSYSVTRSRDGKVISKKRANKKRKAFVTIHNPDGTSRTITKPSKPGKAFVTIHNADGTSRTVTSADR